MVIDGGLPLGLFEDTVASCGDYIDLVKFGWGTALVTPGLPRKIAALAARDIPFMFGGTLFEKFVMQGRGEEYVSFCQRHGCRFVEVSNGTIELNGADKAAFIKRFAAEFTVLAEVGAKDQARSELFSGDQWIEEIRSDLEAGATRVILEARESGTSGICRPDGQLRLDLIEAILGAGIDVNQMIFEAPNKTLQTYFVKHIGPEVNVGNVAPGDVIGLET